MSYRMYLIETVNGVGDIRIGKKSNGDFNIEVGAHEEINIPWQAAEDLAKFILKNT